MMIAKAIWQNQTKHSGFTEFYRYSAEEMQRQILPETENLPFFAKTMVFLQKTPQNLRFLNQTLPRLTQNTANFQ